jgi:hypothetical protein
MPGIVEMGGEVAKSLIPPRDGNKRDMYRWRLSLGIVTAGIAIGLFLFVAVAYGAVPWLNSGFATRDMVQDFAKKDKVEALTETVDKVLRRQTAAEDTALERDIRDLWSKYCTSKDGLRTEYDRQLSDDFITFRNRNKFDHPPLRECPG